MKALVVYDTTHGNTEKVARAIAAAIGGQALRVREVNPADLNGFDLLIVGSPTHGGFPTPEIDGLLKAAPVLKGIHVAAFDTRTKRTIFGYAAPRIARRLERSGADLLAPPEGFLVLGIEGPLMDGELERSAVWACQLQKWNDAQTRLTVHGRARRPLLRSPIDLLQDPLESTTEKKLMRGIVGE